MQTPQLRKEGKALNVALFKKTGRNGDVKLKFNRRAAFNRGFCLIPNFEAILPVSPRVILK